MFVGVHVGGAPAVLMDRAGAVVASGSAVHGPIVSEQVGWAEQDPKDWWRAAKAALRELAEQPGVDFAAVESVGLTGRCMAA